MSIICTVDDKEVDCQTWDDPRETLLQMLRRDAYRKGEFKLSSGRTSEHYVNCKPVTLSGKGIALVSPMLLECVEDDSVACLLYTSPSPRDATLSRMPSSA